MRRLAGDIPNAKEVEQEQVVSQADDIQSECESLRAILEVTFDEGVDMPTAERLAAKCLGVQMKIAGVLASADLDARMRKSGVKAIRSAVYLDEARKGDKKPSDTFLEAIINSSPVVSPAQDALDAAEARRDELHNYFGIFKEAHIYYRGVAKGRFD